MKQLFKGGIVVTGKGTKRCDVLVDGEKIAAVARKITDSEAQVVDCSGKLLLPGFIDGHTHFDLDVAGTVTADDFASGSRSALRGGTTTVVDFACPHKGQTLLDGLDIWRQKARDCRCDYGFHMTIDDWNDTIARQLDDMYAAGISSFKLYMTYPAMMLPDETLYRILCKVRKKGGICIVHCENHPLIDLLTREAKAAGAGGNVSFHSRTRPDLLEGEAVSRLLRMAQLARTPVVIAHLTCRAALREVEAARKRGQTVWVETCPQYLLLDRSGYESDDWDHAAALVCSPPLRTPADQDALWTALRRGEIQTVATDHCSFTPEQKAMGRGDFTAIPGGLPGVETRFSLLYTCGVTTRKISLATACRVLSENPARLYGLFPRKGIIQPGSDADIVVFDPQGSGAIHAADLASRAGYTPYEGFHTQGAIRQVWLRGRLVVDQGMELEHGGGQYIPRGKCSL